MLIALHYATKNILLLPSSDILSWDNLLTMSSIGLSPAPSFSPLFGLLMLNLSSRRLYWAAQVFWLIQSWGLPGSANCFIILDTVTQFWSSDLRTALARVSCSFRDQVSMGVLLRFNLCWTPDIFAVYFSLNKNTIFGVTNNFNGYSFRIYLSLTLSHYAHQSPN